MYCDRRCIVTDVNGQKPSRTKPPGQKPPWTIEIEFVQGTLSGIFVLGLLKIGGIRDVWRTFGGSRDVWQSVTGGSKMAKNSVMYFMDGPIIALMTCNIYHLTWIWCNEYSSWLLDIFKMKTRNWANYSKCTLHTEDGVAIAIVIIYWKISCQYCILRQRQWMMKSIWQRLKDSQQLAV